MTTQRRPHRYVYAAVSADPEGNALLTIHISHSSGYPSFQTDLKLEVEQVYEQQPGVDQLLAIAARLVEYAQGIRGRAVARPTPITSTRRPAEQVGAPRRGATGGGPRSGGRVTRTRDGQNTG